MKIKVKRNFSAKPIILMKSDIAITATTKARINEIIFFNIVILVN